MAIKYLCSVFDRAAETYVNVFQVPSMGVALRDFGDQANNKESPIHHHPDDFELWLLATLDDRSGVVEAELARKAVAKDLIRSDS